MFEVYDKQAVEGTEQHAEGKAEGQQIPKLLQLTGQKQMGALVEAVENVSAMPGEADPPLQLHSIPQLVGVYLSTTGPRRSRPCTVLPLGWTLMYLRPWRGICFRIQNNA